MSGKFRKHFIYFEFLCYFFSKNECAFLVQLILSFQIVSHSCIVSLITKKQTKKQLINRLSYGARKKIASVPATPR